jgi:regulator of sigma E protease
VTFLVTILGLIFLIIVHELGHMLTAKVLGVTVPEFGVGFGPAIFKRKFGSTTYSFRIILLGGFARMAGMGDGQQGPDTFPAKALWRRALIILAGPCANIVVAVAILAGVLMLSGAVMGVKPEVREVERGSMADRVGIRPGDRLVAVGGDRIRTWEGFTREVAERRPGEEISVTVERGEAERRFTGELGADPTSPDRALVGVRPEVIKARYGLLGMFVGDLITGERSLYNNVTGPVGIASVGSTSVEQGFFPQLLALISINLALFNLLPILPLDGGHLAIIAAEKVLGRPLSQETMGRIAALGVALVLMLFVFATYVDLSKIFTGQPFIPK